MRLIKKINSVIKATRPCRVRFGNARGVVFWLKVRKGHKRAPGTQYSLDVPGFRYPIVLRAATSDRHVLEQVIIEREVDFELESEPALIIDAGANIGLTSVVLARKYPSCRILALEVEKANYDLLLRNAAPYPNIVALHTALWSHVGFVRITNPTGAAWAFRVESASATDPCTVPATTVARLLDEFNAPEVSLLKMDIEGSEKAVLSEGNLEWIAVTKVLAVELHDRFVPGCTDAFDALVSTRKARRTTQGEYHVVYFD